MFLNVLRSLLGAPSAASEQPAWREGRRYPCDQFDPSTVGDGCYVYVHEDAAGRVFYVGKGTGRRAWASGRDPLWEQFVATRLEGGRYWVRLVATGLGEEEALDLEVETMALFGDTIVNRQNMSRGLDMEAFEQNRSSTDAMNLLMARAAAEQDPGERLKLLQEAIGLHYASGQSQMDQGIVGELISEMGGYGNTRLISALVDAHLVLGRPEDAKRALETYLAAHPREARLKAIQKLQEKATKGKAPRKTARKEAEFVAPSVLPPDWERAQENGKQVIRLCRNLEPLAERGESRYDAFWQLKSAKRFEDALDYAKRWVVAEETLHARSGTDRTGVPLYHAIAMAKKCGELLDECLLIQRFLHSGKRDPVVVQELRVTLRRRAAALQARMDQLKGAR